MDHSEGGSSVPLHAITLATRSSSQDSSRTMRRHVPCRSIVTATTGSAACSEAAGQPGLDLSSMSRMAGFSCIDGSFVEPRTCVSEPSSAIECAGRRSGNAGKGRGHRQGRTKCCRPPSSVIRTSVSRLKRLDQRRTVCGGLHAPDPAHDASVTMPVTRYAEVARAGYNPRRVVNDCVGSFIVPIIDTMASLCSFSSPCCEAALLPVGSTGKDLGRSVALQFAIWCRSDHMSKDWPPACCSRSFAASAADFPYNRHL